MAYGEILSDKITTSDGVSSAGLYGMKNRIINGNMVIDQRNAGASGTASAFTVDRWNYFCSQASKGTWQQNAASVTPPVGFTNYLGFTSSSAYSVLTADTFRFQQTIEGLNISDLAWGTASAAPITISFWVRSSLTGTFGGSLLNSASTRSYPFTYTILAANTWEQKSITIAGDTSGTWLTTNGVGIYVIFSLGAGATNSGTAGAWTGSAILQPTGSTSVVGTSGATFYITGVQLEKGSTATSFDYRPYGTELQLCQRYLPVLGTSSWSPAYSINTVNGYCAIPFAVTPRVAPTGITTTVAGNLYNGAGGSVALTNLTFNSSGVSGALLIATVASGLTAGQGSVLNNNNPVFFTGCEL